MKKSILSIALGGAVLLGINSCEDLENLCGISQDNVVTGEVFVASLNGMIDIYQRIDQALKDPDLNNTGTAMIDGATCTVKGDSVIIDFGVAGAVSPSDNKTRKGSIRALITGDYTLPNGIAAAKLSNYHVDGIMQKGGFVATNKGPAANPEVTLTTLKYEIGDVSSVDYNLSAFWQAGFDTPDPNDDIFDLQGTINGDDFQNSKMFNGTVLDPLLYNGSCPYFIEQGVMDVGLVGDTALTGFSVDFVQADNCNNIFQITVDCDGSPLVFDYAY